MRVLMVVNEASESGQTAAKRLTEHFRARGIDFSAVNARQATDVRIRPVGEDAALERFDLAVALGGDGTILRTAQFVAGGDTPILGVKYGHLCFLANDCPQSVESLVDDALEGRLAVDERTALLTSVACDDGSHGEFFALNEINIARGPSGRIVDFGLSISGDHVYRMRGDGVLVATSTGSTAYALSAGGPLVTPRFKGLIAIPVAPHSIRSRAILTAPDDTVEIDLTLDDNRNDVVLYSDGFPLHFGTDVKRVTVRRSPATVKLLRREPESFAAQISRVFF